MAPVSMLQRDGERRGAPAGYASSGEEPLDELGWDDEDDFVTVRSGGYRILRALLALVVLAAIGLVLVVVVRGWFRSQLDPAGDPGETIELVIPAGATTGNIATQLEEAKVIPNSTFFRYYTDWKGYGNFQAGKYDMQLNSSAQEATAVLQAGPIPPKFNRFGVREGLWVSEMLPKIAEQIPGMTVEQLQAVLDGGQLQPRYRPGGNPSWEGLLFPAFYDIEDDATPAEVISKMSNEFAKVTGQLGYGAAETKLNLSAYEVIIVASMVEAEAKTDADRPKIARVIYNRLRKQQSLDIDATCLYGAQNHDPGILTKEFMRSGSPYDCRDHPSLPPTPIGAPGKASLAAAINPADNPTDCADPQKRCDWLYYVVMDAQGNHFFTADYDEFINQVNKSKAEGLF
jgi:UPF0755 protein